MGYSTSDAERIARLEAATRATKRLVEQAKAESPALVENCKDDRPTKARTTPRPSIIHQP